VERGSEGRKGRESQMEGQRNELTEVYGGTEILRRWGLRGQKKEKGYRKSEERDRETETKREIKREGEKKRDRETEI